MSASFHDISAIRDEKEEGEIVDDDSVVEDKKDDFFDVLKRSFHKRNVSSQNGSFYQSLDATLGGGDSGVDSVGDTGGNAKNIRDDQTRLNKPPKKELKALKDRCKIRQELNNSFSAFDDKVSKRKPSLEITGEVPAHFKPNRPSVDSSFQRALALHSVLRDNKRDKENVRDDNDVVFLGRNEDSFTAQLIHRAIGERSRAPATSTTDQEDKRLTTVAKSILATVSAAKPFSASTAASSLQSGPASELDLFAKAVRSTILNAPPSSSTPKRERIYYDRPANSKPILDAFALRTTPLTSTRSNIFRSRPVKRAMSPSDDDVFHQTKRNRLETVDPTQRRPLFAANRRPRTSSMSTVFRSPRAGPSGRHHVRPRTTVAVEQDTEYNRQKMLAKTIDEKYDHIIFVDLDNWINFFGHLRSPLPSKAFVWAFWGRQTNWIPPRGNPFFQQLVASDRFEETMAGSGKDAADFAMVLKLGQMDTTIKRDIGFTIVTGDRGFEQVRNDFRWAKRSVNVINPHTHNRNPYFNIDDAIQSHCRRSQSVEPKLRNFALNEDFGRGRQY